MIGDAGPNQGVGLRIGIIGAGGHATHQIYPCLDSLPVRLAAVCDIDEVKAEHNARRFGADSVYADHSTMLSDASLDAVIVCVGADHHSKLAIDVMEAGLPVWTEKPPAASAADAAAVLAASRRTGQICMTGFMKRFAPVYRRARSAVASPDFGPPCLLAIDWSFGVAESSWLEMFLLDFGVHMVDLARYMFGEVTEVFARDHFGVAYAVTLTFANGAVGTLSMTANRGLDITEEVHLTGSYGNHLTIDRSGRLMRYRGNTVLDYYDRPLALQDSLVDIGYQGELAEFVSAVRDRREPESSIASSYETMRVYDAIRHSAQELRVVCLDEIDARS
ncbi:Gfo/Idh/MocA family protein [Jiangella alba]|uniref:Predicted dehydrogenase n=1 Tax=Jiangella alba TaxID=561176 RepID=A0A1H5JUI2_9ACTN|nr:Gfo/Idh/MocA family oxidoreductase [Jiangella alba]SEE56215.1 Predicted dehydrogenase [Jiangella alba]